MRFILRKDCIISSALSFMVASFLCMPLNNAHASVCFLPDKTMCGEGEEGLGDTDVAPRNEENGDTGDNNGVCDSSYNSKSPRNECGMACKKCVDGGRYNGMYKCPQCGGDNPNPTGTCVGNYRYTNSIDVCGNPCKMCNIPGDPNYRKYECKPTCCSAYNKDTDESVNNPCMTCEASTSDLDEQCGFSHTMYSCTEDINCNQCINNGYTLPATDPMVTNTNNTCEKCPKGDWYKNCVENTDAVCQSQGYTLAADDPMVTNPSYICEKCDKGDWYKNCKVDPCDGTKYQYTSSDLAASAPSSVSKHCRQCTNSISRNKGKYECDGCLGKDYTDSTCKTQFGNSYKGKGVCNGSFTTTYYQGCCQVCGSDYMYDAKQDEAHYNCDECKNDCTSGGSKWRCVAIQTTPTCDEDNDEFADIERCEEIAEDTDFFTCARTGGKNNQYLKNANGCYYLMCDKWRNYFDTAEDCADANLLCNAEPTEDYYNDHYCYTEITSNCEYASQDDCPGHCELFADGCWKPWEAYNTISFASACNNILSRVDPQMPGCFTSTFRSEIIAACNRYIEEHAQALALNNDFMSDPSTWMTLKCITHNEAYQNNNSGCSSPRYDSLLNDNTSHGTIWTCGYTNYQQKCQDRRDETWQGNAAVRASSEDGDCYVDYHTGQAWKVGSEYYCTYNEHGDTLDDYSLKIDKDGIWYSDSGCSGSNDYYWSIQSQGYRVYKMQ